MLKIAVEDDFESPITLLVFINGKERSFNANEYIDPTRNENGIYYIPLEKLGFLTKRSYVIEVYAIDGKETEDDETTLVKLDSPIYYATSNYNIDSSYVNDYLFKEADDEHIAELKNKYDAFFKAIEDSSVNFDVSDDIGIVKYEIEIDGVVSTSADLSKGEITVETVTDVVVVTDDDGNPVIDEDGKTVTTTVETKIEKYLTVTKKSVSVPLDGYSLTDGEHTIKLKITNSVGESYDKPVQILIDTTAPVINGNSYESINVESQASLLKYLTFGIFGNEEITIRIDASDNTSNLSTAGIKNVVLNWSGESFYASLHDGIYAFSGLKPNNNGIPSITLIDYLGNSTTYNLVSPIDKENSSSGKVTPVTLKNGKVSLMLEDKKPSVHINLPPSDSKEKGNPELWYKGDISFSVDARDDQESSSFYSGLNKVNVKLEKSGNETPIFEFSEYSLNEEYNFVKAKFDGTATFDHYEVQGDGHFTITAKSFDNAFNESEEDIRNIHIDSTDPEIVSFTFADSVNAENDSLHKYDSYEIKPYGYYFKETTLLKVVVKDQNTSSGFYAVKLWLDSVEGSNSECFEHGVTIENGEAYSIFEIKPNFKGRVIAEVIDNVGHSSGQISADGDIVEDEFLHGSVSSLDIHEDVDTDKQDANGVPLYNRNIPLIITATDSFSGISRIEWSIENDNKQGTINIDNSKRISQEGAEASSIESLSEDNNLITSLKFAISVDSNTNGNVVKIRLIDRSGNASEISRTYSIDTTTPTISATFGNTNAQNGNYYKDTQTVNIAITERNFNGSDVQVKLNGDVQQVTWDDNGATVGQDSTVHNASFNISADGDYTYEISYTDRAGNAATTVTSSQFTIDTIDPKADISFNIGDKNLNDAYYNEDRTVTFNIDEHNYSNATVHITKDGKDVSENYDLNNWNPKDHSGDNHTQSVVLSENGYYVVSIDVTYKSGRTVSQKSNGFYIDKNAPVVSIEVSNVVNGAPSNAEIITPVVSVKDFEGNLDPETITLTVTAIKLDSNHEIIPDIKKYIGLDEWKKADIGIVTVDEETNPNTITFNFNNLEDDGIYTFEVTASDKAGNTGGDSQEDKNNGAKYKISINRLGSTYEVDAKIAEVDPNLRYFRNKENTLFSFTITEYNVNQLKANDTIVKMTCDGIVVENDVVAIEDTGSDKWSKYTYEFPSELMDNSGKYIVKLYSIDEAGNENPLEVDGQDERATVTFFIDNDDPTVAFRDADDKTEFIDKANYRTDSKHIEVEVYDNSQQEARNVIFKLDGEDLTTDVQHEPGTMIYTLTIPSKSSAQNLSVSLEDIAGNHLETGVEDFLITTNLFVLWFSNTPLFIGSIVAIILAIAGIVVLIIKKKSNRSRGF